MAERRTRFEGDRELGRRTAPVVENRTGPEESHTAPEELQEHRKPADEEVRRIPVDLALHTVLEVRCSSAGHTGLDRVERRIAVEVRRTAVVLEEHRTLAEGVRPIAALEEVRRTAVVVETIAEVEVGRNCYCSRTFRVGGRKDGRSLNEN